MIWAQSGHFTIRPSGTRLGLSWPATGLRPFVRSFFHHAISAQLIKFRPEGGRANRLIRRRPGARDVVLRARSHQANLPDQIVERLVARFRVELRGFDDEQRRGGVVKEKMM